MKAMKKILLWFLVTAILIWAGLWLYRLYINLTVWDSSPYGVNVIASYPDGKILIWRRFTYGYREQILIRLNADWTEDKTFNIGKWFSENKDQYNPDIGIRVSVKSILIQSDGKILVGGYFGEYNWEGANNIVRLNSDGSIDHTFDTGSWFDWSISTLAQQGEKILVAGDFTNYNWVDVKWIIRLNKNWELDKTFITKDLSGGDLVLVLPNNQILVGWSFMSVGSFRDGNLQDKNLVRLDSNGAVYSLFSDEGFNKYSSIRTILGLQEGKIMVGGNFQTYAWVKVNWIVRLMRDGSIDRTFKQGNWFDVSDDNVNHVTTIEPLPNGKIIVGWVFTRYNGHQVGNMVVLDSEGNIDSTAKNSHFDYEVRDIHLAGENVWVGWDFFKYWFRNVVGLTKIPLKSFE